MLQKWKKKISKILPYINQDILDHTHIKQINQENDKVKKPFSFDIIHIYMYVWYTYTYIHAYMMKTTKSKNRFRLEA